MIFSENLLDFVLAIVSFGAFHLPIHSSQKELKGKELREVLQDGDNPDDVYFSIFVCPNENLIMEFCKFAGRVEVLSPDSVRKAVAEQLQKAIEQYSQNT